MQVLEWIISKAAVQRFDEGRAELNAKAKMET